MKIQKGSGIAPKININMTPMIDACFQLIIFFLLTLKLLSPEGDFAITMPIASPRAGPPPLPESPPVKIRLIAHPDGKLASIQMGQRKLSSFSELHHQIREVVGFDRGPAGSTGAEVELDCDYNLKFEHVVDALNAVSGYVANDKQTVIRMIEKIRFAPPRPPPAENNGNNTDEVKPKTEDGNKKSDAS